MGSSRLHQAATVTTIDGGEAISDQMMDKTADDCDQFEEASSDHMADNDADEGSDLEEAHLLGQPSWRREVESPVTLPTTRAWYKRGEPVMVLAVFIFAAQTAIVKQVETLGVPSFEVVAVRSTFSTIITIITFSIQRRRARTSLIRLLEAPKVDMAAVDKVRRQVGPFVGRRAHLGLLAVRGAIGSVAFAFELTGLHYLAIGDAVSLFFTGPVWIAVLSPFLLKEHVRPTVFAAILVSFVGTVLVVRPPAVMHLFAHANTPGHEGSADDTTGAETGHEGISIGVPLELTAAVFMAFAMLAIRKIGEREPPFVLTLWFQGCSTALGYSLLAMGLQRPVGPRYSKEQAMYLGVAALTSVSGQYLLNLGFAILPAARAGALFNLQVLISFGLDAVVLQHSVPLLSVLGGLFIVVGALIAASARAPAEHPQQPEEERTPSNHTSPTPTGAIQLVPVLTANGTK